MGTAKSPGLSHVHPFMGAMAATHVSLGKGAKDVILGTAVMGGTRVERGGLVATTITATVAQRAETRTQEVTHGTLHTSEY